MTVRPLTYEQARDLCYLALVLRRFERLLAACDGDRDQALRVLGELGRVELSAMRRAA